MKLAQRTVTGATTFGKNNQGYPLFQERAALFLNLVWCVSFHIDVFGVTHDGGEEKQLTVRPVFAQITKIVVGLSAQKKEVEEDVQIIDDNATQSEQDTSRN